jgi:queuosine precursor transporter
MQLFSILSSFFVATLIISNTVSEKIFTVFGFNFPGGAIVFPISYIFGDILTEVYGYQAARKIIWTGLGCLALMSAVYATVQILPPASFWTDQAAYERILGMTPRIAFASAIAYFAGEFSNSYTIAKLKIFTQGKHLWLRIIGSTMVGQTVDTAVFTTIAFLGIFTSMEM